MEDDEWRTVWEVLRDALPGVGYRAGPSSLVRHESGHFKFLVDEVTPDLAQLLASFPLPVVVVADASTSIPRGISPAEQRRRSIERVEWLTPRLRASADPHWLLLRRLLTAESVDVDSAWLADGFDDDVGIYFGVVVTCSGDVFEFEYAWNVDQERDQATIVRWENKTHTWVHGLRVHVHPIAAALELADVHVPALADLHL